MKKLISLLIILCLFVGCGNGVNKTENEKITVVTTLFPQYDFCRQIARDKMEVVLLLPPGMESHNFEPGVGDIKTVANCDLFIYTGENMEPWAHTIIETLDGVKTLNVSKNINLCLHEHTNEEHHHEHEETDPHIWTSPKNAKIMAENILSALIEIDGTNADYYKDNASVLFNELDELDSEFLQLKDLTKNLTLCHGGKFAMGYLQRDYGFDFLSAYDSCASSQEPSVVRVKEIVDKISSQKLKGVFVEELNRGRVAETISKETGVPVYVLHTCHNLSKTEFMQGETYVSLMKKNIVNIKKVITDAEC